MPTFTTPTPIDLALHVHVGAVEIVAGDRGDTVVTVSPSDPGRAADRRGAEQTVVAFDAGRLTITAPKPKIAVFGPSESIDIHVALPSGSRLTAEIGMGRLASSGRLGATRVKSGHGPVELDATGDLWLRAAHGNAIAGAVDGSVDVVADHGQIRLGPVSGDGAIKASHGSVRIEETGGDLQARLSYGDLEIGRSLASVTAKTSYGAVDVGEVSSGSIDVQSGFGRITVGVREGVPAWLDLASKEGRVRTELAPEASAPAASEASVAVRARTQFGDISIRRAS